MRHNGRTPLLLSKIRSDCVELGDSEIRSVICEDCGTWRVVRRGMVAAHRSEPRSSMPADRRQSPPDRVPRCPGSGQRITADRKFREAMPAENRRAARQFHKPIPAPAAPVHRIVPPAPSAESVRRTFRSHQLRCVACKGQVADQNGELLTCADGERLAVTYLRLLRQEPKRARVREFFARERVRFDRIHVAQAAERRAAEWARAVPAPRQQVAKRGGAAVEETNNQCRAVREGAVSEFRGPDVPLTTLRIAA
jgi:hypothetical protein